MVGDMVESGHPEECFTVVIHRQAKFHPGKAKVPGSNPGGGSTLYSKNVS